MPTHPANPAAELRSSLADLLKPLTSPLTAALRRLLAHPFPTDLWRIDFEFDEAFGFSHGFPVAYAFSRRRWRPEVGDYPLSVYPSDVRDPLVDAPHSDLGSLVEPCLDAGIDPGEVANSVFVPWFHRCWLAAGGSGFPYRAVIGQHDDRNRFDLMTGRWFEDVGEANEP
jgi:hypothetical protein